MIDYTLPLDQLPDPLPIEPLTKPFDVTITPPGSKSITCRAYVLAALAKGESRIIRPLRAEDTDYLLNALCTLGAEARWVPGEGHDGEDVLIKGVAGRFPRGGSVYLGDGGTPTRFMIACACLAAEPVVVDASPHAVRERPIAEGVDMLRQLGANIEYVEAEGRLPVRVVPSPDFKGGELEIGQTASSQFISAVMLIAPFLPSGVTIRFSAAPTSGSYLQLTLELLHCFRVRYHRNLLSRFSRTAMRRIGIRHCRVKSTTFRVEVDASSTTYWVLATLAARKSHAFVPWLPVWSHQPDLAAIRAAGEFGAITLPWEMTAGDERGIGTESDAPRSSKVRSVCCGDFPDGSIAIAAATVLAQIGATLTGLRTLRAKETDRIAALTNELRRVGCTVETGEDWIEITPHSPPQAAGLMGVPVIIETYNDHRMAMAFAVLGLNPPGGKNLAIRNPKCVAKSYPTFWNDFAKLYGGTEAQRDKGTKGN